MVAETTWILDSTFEAEKLGKFGTYIAAVYYTVTTITTVGYGDHSPVNTTERLVGILTMILGVIAFSYATGSLSSLIFDND